MSGLLKGTLGKLLGLGTAQDSDTVTGTARPRPGAAAGQAAAGAPFAPPPPATARVLPPIAHKALAQARAASASGAPAAVPPAPAEHTPEPASETRAEAAPPADTPAFPSPAAAPLSEAPTALPPAQPETAVPAAAPPASVDTTPEPAPEAQAEAAPPVDTPAIPSPADASLSEVPTAALPPAQPETTVPAAATAASADTTPEPASETQAEAAPPADPPAIPSPADASLSEVPTAALPPAQPETAATAAASWASADTTPEPAPETQAEAAPPADPPAIPSPVAAPLSEVPTAALPPDQPESAEAEPADEDQPGEMASPDAPAEVDPELALEERGIAAEDEVPDTMPTVPPGGHRPPIASLAPPMPPGAQAPGSLRSLFGPRTAANAPADPAPAEAPVPDRWVNATPSNVATPSVHPLKQLSIARINVAREMIKLGDHAAAIAPLEAALREGPPLRDVYRLLGEIYFVQERWQDSLAMWYRTASMTARNDEKMKYSIHRKVMRCNAQIALHELRRGDRVLAAEYISRAVEAVDQSVYLKVRRDMVDPIVAYIREELESRGGRPVTPRAEPLNILICLDVIKVSPVHSHKHLYVSLAAALATLDPRITVTIVATYERQITWNAGFDDYYRPDNIAFLRDFIAEKVPADLLDRISVRHFESFGLRGVIETCRALLDMQPDVILYGGGRSGYHSNESLVVRHALHAYVPTAFFFVQSNNDVDEVVDAIIPRGNHPLNGDPKGAPVIPSPYPPFPGLQAAVVPDSLSKLPADRKRIVTAWVGVRLDNTLNGYTAEQIDRILALLEAVPDADWHLIGSENPKELLAKHKKFNALRTQGRIKVHPVLNYDEFYHMASSAALFFQPPGFTGGGGGAAIARKNNVPIICHAHSDVAPLQPQDFVFDEEAQIEGLEMAFRVLTDIRMRNLLISGQNALLEARRNEAPDRFYGALKAAVAHYVARQDPRA